MKPSRPVAQRTGQSPELGEPVDERTDLPTLIKRALKALGLQPEVLAPDAEGAEVT